ncbi:MAG TPA: phosphohydrolase, partial [Acidimicrobiales bacterium]|nr:phosphohydrolase [Acidimicrobiales bacterium]
HDIGDTLGSFNHPDIGAAIVKPFVRDSYHWMVANHGLFQGYYFFHFLGLDRDGRDAYRDHPDYELTVEFCAEFDQVAFDPAYDTEPLEHFEPLLRDLMAKPLNSIYRRA